MQKEKPGKISKMREETNEILTSTWEMWQGVVINGREVASSSVTHSAVSLTNELYEGKETLTFVSIRLKYTALNSNWPWMISQTPYYFRSKDNAEMNAVLLLW